MAWCAQGMSFARVESEQKRRLMRPLQANGEVVALTLDPSVGPRPKLVEASIGKGLRPIFATAPQFPSGGSGALEKSNVHSGLAAILGFNRGI